MIPVRENSEVVMKFTQIDGCNQISIEWVCLRMVYPIIPPKCHGDRENSDWPSYFGEFSPIVQPQFLLE